MKFSLASILACGLAVEAHTIFQKVSINGKDQGQLTGIRAPNNNNPVQDVTSQNMICGAPGTKSNTILNVAAGDRIGMYWGHVIGGAQFANDVDHPIAKSHKGPVMAYLAKVDNAASTGTSGLKWFKVWQETFDTGSKKWGVDTMLQNQGWVYFNMPTCIAPGQYLLRGETLALHSANKPNQAQFYQSCAQINISGSGSFTPSSTISIPGAYKASDAGISANIYGLAGQPDNGGKPYLAPGPEPIKC
ncbi:glycoside hydrolase family 61 protein [Lasiosphaeria hispida]|uniref:lytic cellulose monooxygenase (C4-dehydrogenating) n=1 Tax=Lasiosphaeria hispida TaxID=260671 RepID=A0AAJ0HS26_9PEZI|nr:glycoside hydrolase family 61 protein [Lasiosphaeria hispida]